MAIKGYVPSFSVRVFQICVMALFDEYGASPFMLLTRYNLYAIFRRVP